MATPEPADLKTPAPPSAAPPRPVMDEWGIFDPAQAGIEAMLRRVAAAPREKTTGPIK